MKALLSLILAVLISGCCCSEFLDLDPVTISDVMLCSDVTDDGICVGEATSFPDGTSQVHVLFDYLPTTNEGGIEVYWTFEDAIILDDYFSLKNDVLYSPYFASTVAALEDDSPIPVGNYKVEIMYDGKVLESKSFTVG